MNDPAVIITSRLIIRPLQPSDIQALAPIWADPRVMWFIDGPLSLNQAKVQLQNWLEDYAKNGYGFMALQRLADGEIIGNSGFLQQVIAGKNHIEIGYCLGFAHWGQNYAFEAVQALIEYGFVKLQFPALIAIIRPENYASLKLANKVGMRLLKTRVIDGNFSKVLGIFRDDYAHRTK